MLLELLSQGDLVDVVEVLDGLAQLLVLLTLHVQLVDGLDACLRRDTERHIVRCLMRAMANSQSKAVTL